MILSILRLQLERLGEDARRHDREVRKLEDSIGRLSNCVDRARTKVRWAACMCPPAAHREASWVPSATSKSTCIGRAPCPQAADTECFAACKALNKLAGAAVCFRIRLIRYKLPRQGARCLPWSCKASLLLLCGSGI